MLKLFITSFLLGLTACASFDGLGDYVRSSEYRATRVGESEEVAVSTELWKPSGAFSINWPVYDARLTQEFRPRKNASHQGIDLAGPRGRKILAAHTGYVIYAGRAFRGYGRMVIIEYDKTWATLYAHLNSIKVKEGDLVHQGDKIGTMGRSGRASGVHLHFELMKNKIPVDPLPLLDSTSRIANQ